MAYPTSQFYQSKNSMKLRISKTKTLGITASTIVEVKFLIVEQLHKMKALELIVTKILNWQTSRNPNQSKFYTRFTLLKKISRNLQKRYISYDNTKH